MPAFTETRLPAQGVRSLAWRGDQLVDWVGGGRILGLDGSEVRASVSYAYRFDAVTASPDGRWAVLHERLGTKGLLLRDGAVVRQLDRSFYHAHVYEFPAYLFDGAQGRVLLAHCPERYDRVVVEDAETGDRLAASAPTDMFYSRLAANPAGTRLLSAGWLWHPLDWLALFTLPTLEGADLELPEDTGELLQRRAACWLSDDRIVIDLADEVERRAELVVYDVPRRELVGRVPLERPVGPMLPIGETHVVSFHLWPRLIELATGAVVHDWRDLPGTPQASSIIWQMDHQPIPPLALDPPRRRFAMARDDAVVVVQVDAV